MRALHRGTVVSILLAILGAVLLALYVLGGTWVLALAVRDALRGSQALQSPTQAQRDAARRRGEAW